jgi:hypothetical protein
MGNLFTKHNKSINLSTVVPQEIKETIQRIKNNSVPCCGKSDIRFNSKDNLIECLNCETKWVD